MLAVPLQPQSFYGRTDEVLAQFIEVHVFTSAGVKYHTGLRVSHGKTIHVQNFRQLPNDGHRLGRWLVSSVDSQHSSRSTC
jgi:hypothetical protein